MTKQTQTTKSTGNDGLRLNHNETQLPRTKSKARVGLSLLVVAAVCGWSGVASAAQHIGYVCFARWTPASSIYGTQGSLQLELNTRPACGGQKVNSVATYYLSSGATVGNKSYFLNETKMAAMLNGLHQAAIGRTRVMINTNSFGGGEQAAETTFYAD